MNPCRLLLHHFCPVQTEHLLEDCLLELGRALSD